MAAPCGSRDGGDGCRHRNWPHCRRSELAPPLSEPRLTLSALSSARRRSGGSDESGAVRADQARSRARGLVDPGAGKAPRRSSPRRPPGARTRRCRRPSGGRRSRPAPKLDPFKAVIDEWLTDDQKAPRKQRHTARRVWQRWWQEHGATVSERQVDRYVATKRRADRRGRGLRAAGLRGRRGGRGRLGRGAGDHARRAGQGPPVPDARLPLGRRLRGRPSRPRPNRPSSRATSPRLEFFGGVFGLIRYDNLKAAVAKVMKGRRRVESDRFVALRSHYGFESSFCLTGEAGRPRKGRRRERGRPLSPSPPGAGAQGRIAGAS